MQIAIISDTHLPRGGRRLPADCVATLRAADLIVHAGDLMAAAIVGELGALGPPLAAVRGNVDDAAVRALLPETRVVEAAGARLAVIHDAGPATGRLARMGARFPQADAVIFGHSHVPLHETGPGGFQIFNPGSPTERRRAPSHTMGLARITNRSISFAHLTLTD